MDGRTAPGQAGALGWSAAERVELQRRVVRVLMLGQVVSAAALAAGLTVGGYVVADPAGADSPWVGVATAAITVGSGVMSQVLSQLMRRRGRRGGMVVGYACAAA